MDNMNEIAKVVAETVKAETDKMREEMKAEQEKARRDSCEDNKYFSPLMAAPIHVKDWDSVPKAIFVATDREKREFARGGLQRCIQAVVATKKGFEPVEYARKYFPQDEILIKALGTDLGSAGGFLIPDEYSAELIEMLRAKSIVRRAGPRVITIENNLNITKLTGGGTGYWIGDNDAITESQQTLGQVRLDLKTCAAMVPVSNKLLATSHPSAEQMIKEDLVKTLATTEDAALLRGTGTSNSPKGILKWASSTAGSSTTPVTFTSQIADLWTLIYALDYANVSTDPSECVWFFAPRTKKSLMTKVSSTGERIFAPEMRTGKLEGYPFFDSTNVPINLTPGTASEIAFVNMSDVILAEGRSLRIDVSDQATWVSGGTTYSCFQNDQTLIRVLQDVDLAVRHTESIAYFNDTIWT